MKSGGSCSNRRLIGVAISWLYRMRRSSPGREFVTPSISVKAFSARTAFRSEIRRIVLEPALDWCRDLLVVQDAAKLPRQGVRNAQHFCEGLQREDRIQIGNPEDRARTGA